MQLSLCKGEELFEEPLKFLSISRVVFGGGGAPLAGPSLQQEIQEIELERLLNPFDDLVINPGSESSGVVRIATERGREGRGLSHLSDRVRQSGSSP